MAAEPVGVVAAAAVGAAPVGTVGVIVVAAGSGSRFGGPVPKAFVPLSGRPLLAWALEAAAGSAGVSCTVVVAPASHLDEAERVVAIAHGGPVVVAGGTERTDSVAAGLAALPDDVAVVLVHDAARALAPTSLFDQVAAAVRAGHVAVVPGLPVVDTVKQVDQAGFVTATPDRRSLRAVQTPQGFRRDVLVAAHAAAARGSVTDDAVLVEDLGMPVLVVPGDPLAQKITTRADLDRAEALVAGRRAAAQPTGSRS